MTKVEIRDKDGNIKRTYVKVRDPEDGIVEIDSKKEDE